MRIEHPFDQLEKVEHVRRDMTDVSLSLRQVARRNNTSLSMVQRIRDEQVEPAMWRPPPWKDERDRLQERCEMAERHERDLIADMKILIGERDRLRAELSRVYG